ncbi:MAG: hypothetical protein H6729_13145 [Deltaproteobacteria bacterium]|nr:hypothetical protein [Deltaproteobacteria bacterium]
MTRPNTISIDRAAPNPAVVAATLSTSKESPDAYAARALDRHEPTIRAFCEAHADAKLFSALTETPGYAELTKTLRRAAIEVKAAARAPHARAVIEEASRRLDVPSVDLYQLAHVPAHLVAQGKWRPRSINVAFLQEDATTRAVPRDAFQKKLNNISNWLPPVRDHKVPGLRHLYTELGTLLPAAEKVGDGVSAVFRRSAAIVQGWSDALTSETQRTLRGLRHTLSGGKVREPKSYKFTDDDRRVILSAAKVLSHQVGDIDAVITRLRAHKEGDDASTTHRLIEGLSEGLNDVAGFLDGFGRWVAAGSREDAWRTFTLHLQTNIGLEKWGQLASRASVIAMLPTLEQVEKTGEAKVRVNFKLTPVDTLFFSLYMSGRGGGYLLRAGYFGASINDFEHEIRFQVPGVMNVALGEDYSYGPMGCLGYSPKIGDLSDKLPVNVRVGGYLKVYHTALRNLTAPTRRMAEEFTIHTSLAREAWGRHRDKRKGRAHVVPVQDGWPSSQLWLVARGEVKHGERARQVIARRVGQIQEVLTSADARRAFVTGAEEAGLSPREANALPESSLKFLRDLDDAISRESTDLDAMAHRAAKDQPYSLGELRGRLNNVRRLVANLEFVDQMLARTFGEHPVPRRGPAV